MHAITLKHILKIMQDSFNVLDPRLIGHGNQVSYILSKMLGYKKGYTDSQLLDFCALAVFHDIGAYKTEVLNDIIKFEVTSPYNHSIYGSLFIKHFSPLAYLSDVILYHHLDYSHKNKASSKYLNEAFLFHLADRVAIWLTNYGYVDREILYKLADTKFSKEHIDLFFEADRALGIIEKVQNNSYIDELYSFFNTRELTYAELLAYSKMFVYSIDFRSEHTVHHTITVTSLSRLLCQKLGIDEKSTGQIMFGAFMHDIGKISTPVSILEKPGKLTHDEMSIMKNHVVVTYAILKNLGLDEIIEIASYHHEKLDGTGYPFGLKGSALSLSVRIVMAADILSALLGKRSYKDPFPKERILKILMNLSTLGKIDSDITSLIIINYDEIVETLYSNSLEAVNEYKHIKTEYEDLSSYFNNHFSSSPNKLNPHLKI